MKFLPFGSPGECRLAVVVGERALDLAELSPTLPTSLMGVMAGGHAMLEDLARRIASDGLDWKPLTTFRPAYPVSWPHKVICVGLNYVAHAREGGNAIPDYPAFFLRTPESMLEAGAPMIRPHVSEKLDYEAELMVVIGQEARYIAESEALDVVFGYSIFNDGSVRDYQRKGGQWTPGKNFDRTGAVGPFVVTADALPPGAHGLDIQCRLNGAVMQSSNTSDMIFSVQRAVSLASEFTTLKPGDMIAMGTPSGVGYPRNPPVFLKPGDSVEVEIEGIGILRHGIADEHNMGRRS
jgi:acylpyruvate hydrolase